ncbi:MAG: hypothetical protein Q7J73_06650 [Dehalococcoidales bacterium]|nr:hypothetical protein [Dehalococcoidales bacterium]
MNSEVVGPMWVGFIPFTIIVGSLSLAVIASILIRPAVPRVTLVFVGTIFSILTAFIAATWAGGVFFSFVIP